MSGAGMREFHAGRCASAGCEGNIAPFACERPVPISTLLVTCESAWLAPIRMPGALARAGFEVTLLAPPDAVAARSRYVARSRALPANANPREWLLALVVVKPSNGTGGRDVMPCDSPDAAAAACQRVWSAQRGPAMLDREAAVIVQRRIVGQMLGRTSAAWHGAELAGFSRERLQTIRALGGSAVVRYVHAPEPASSRDASRMRCEAPGS
jgi:hypothetical protein